METIDWENKPIYLRFGIFYNPPVKKTIELENKPIYLRFEILSSASSTLN